MWDYLFDIQLNNPPQIKSLLVSSSFFTPGRPYAPLRSQLLHCMEAQTMAYVKQHCILLLLLTVWEATRLTWSRSLENPTRLHRGPPMRPFCTHLGIKHDSHTLSSRHGSDTTCKDLRHHPKRLTY